MSIDLGNSLPGIMGLLKFNPATSGPISELVEQLLRRETSTLSRGERELIFATASWGNDCQFCAGVHAASAKAQMYPNLVEAVRLGGPCTIQDDSPKMHELLHIAVDIVSLFGRDLRTRMDENVRLARSAGATDQDIHDTVLIASTACMINKYVDGMETTFPADDPSFFVETAASLMARGYSNKFENVVGYAPGQPV